MCNWWRTPLTREGGASACVTSTCSWTFHTPANTRRIGWANAAEVYCMRELSGPKPQSQGALRRMGLVLRRERRRPMKKVIRMAASTNGAEYEATSADTGVRHTHA